TSQTAASSATAAYPHSTPKPPHGLIAVSNRCLVCWIARPAAGVSRLIHFSTANDGTNEATICGTSTSPTTSVIALADRRRISPTPRRNTASTARNRAVRTTGRSTDASASDGGGYAGGRKPCRRSPGWARKKAAKLATSPATNTAAPTTIAFATSTRPRRGLAANVVRTMPVLYSPAANSTPSATTASRPSWIPDRLTTTISPSPPPS